MNARRNLPFLIIASIVIILFGCWFIIYKYEEPEIYLKPFDGLEYNSQSKDKITVYITGQVENPGLYKMPAGCKVIDCIETAGGLLSSADTDKVNLAKTVADGEQIHVPSKSEKDNSGEMIIVYVTGQVENPGLHKLPAGSRVEDCIEAAGGLLSTADTEKVNIGKILTDGEQVHIPGKSEKDNSVEMIIVYVTGQVENPGLHKLPAGSRVEDCIEAAGGLLSTADTEKVNIGKIVADGEQVHIPGKSEKSSERPASAPPDFVKINLNTATEQELTKLPGIGATLSARIIAYREAKGLFLYATELKDVDGISEKLYDSIKDYIYVE